MREKKEKKPFLKKSPGEKSNTPPFLQFSGRTLSHEKYPFTGHFGNTHAVILTSEWGAGPIAPIPFCSRNIRFIGAVGQFRGAVPKSPARAGIPFKHI